MDADQSGFLVGDEIQAAVAKNKGGMVDLMKKFGKDPKDKLFMAFLDSNSDEHVSEKEFVDMVMYKGIDDKNITELKNVFNMILRDFDVDLTGTLSREELKTGINSKPEYVAVVKKHRDISNNKEAAKFWSDLDPNGDDVITEEEFVTATMWVVTDKDREEVFRHRGGEFVIAPVCGS